MKCEFSDLQVRKIDERNNYGISIWKLYGYVELTMGHSLKMDDDSSAVCAIVVTIAIRDDLAFY